VFFGSKYKEKSNAKNNNSLWGELYSWLYYFLTLFIHLELIMNVKYYLSKLKKNKKAASNETASYSEKIVVIKI